MGVHLQEKHGLDIAGEWRHAPDSWRERMTDEMLAARHADLHEDGPWNEASDRHEHLEPTVEGQGEHFTVIEMGTVRDVTLRAFETSLIRASNGVYTLRIVFTVDPDKPSEGGWPMFPEANLEEILRSCLRGVIEMKATA